MIDAVERLRDVEAKLARDEITRLRSDLERAMDSLGDVPGETLDERLTTFIGYYMAMQIEVPKAMADLARARKALEHARSFIEMEMSLRGPDAGGHMLSLLNELDSALTEIAH